MTLVELITILIYLFYQVQVIFLISKKTGILAKYSHSFDVFSLHFIAELSELIKINNYSINLQNNKKLSYSLIYSLKLINLKILKIYIKINLASGFIKSFKFFSSTLILFIQKKR